MLRIYSRRRRRPVRPHRCRSGCGPIEENIIAAGFEPTAILALVLTHCHIDHVGGAIGLPTSVPRSWPTNWTLTPSRPMSQAGRPWITMPSATTRRRRVRGGETLRYGDLGLRIIHAPGHTPGSIVLTEEIAGRTVLFGQDVHGPLPPKWG
ncbi:MAG TPA: MBL fold metallo-hydrolase [Thermoplasmata archaeon]|nr:MBL fold metallo-hydrolase [Thermoplasmata archaeon]